MVQRHGLALHLIGVLQHGRDQGFALGYGLACAACILDGQGGNHLRVARRECRHQGGDLVDFAAQSDQDDTGKVRVFGIASQRALQDSQTFSVTAHATAAAMGDGDDTIDIRIALGQGGVESVGNVAADGGRAIDAGNDADVVARPHAAIGSDIAVECAGHGCFLGRPVSSTDCVLLVRGHHAQIVGMHMGTGRNGSGGHTDRLPVFQDGLARRDIPQGKFMAGGDIVLQGDGQAVQRDGRTRRQGFARDRHRVGSSQAECLDRGGIFSRAGHGGYVCVVWGGGWIQRVDSMRLRRGCARARP